jgi:nitrogen fixation protein FixH
MIRNFTGRHMAAILVLFFGAVMAVNFTMARYASSTFGGRVVENSYVASQNFNQWLDQAAEQEALGWEAEVQRTASGEVAVNLSGAPAGATVEASARHPLGRMADVDLTFAGLGEGRYLSREALAQGRWTVRLVVSQGDVEWRREVALQ